VRAADPAELERLMDAATYGTKVEGH
jgi:hypothetical protein